MICAGYFRIRFHPPLPMVSSNRPRACPWQSLACPAAAGLLPALPRVGRRPARPGVCHSLRLAPESQDQRPGRAQDVDPATAQRPLARRAIGTQCHARGEKTLMATSRSNMSTTMLQKLKMKPKHCGTTARVRQTLRLNTISNSHLKNHLDYLHCLDHLYILF